jgi:hypothetical protein
MLIVNRLHPTWHDIVKQKYTQLVTQLVTQNGPMPHIPLECTLPMIVVKINQWCNEEWFESPSSAKINFKKLKLFFVPSSLIASCSII